MALLSPPETTSIKICVMGTTAPRHSCFESNLILLTFFKFGLGSAIQTQSHRAANDFHKPCESMVWEHGSMVHSNFNVDFRKTWQCSNLRLVGMGLPFPSGRVLHRWGEANFQERRKFINTCSPGQTPHQVSCACHESKEAT